VFDWAGVSVVPELSGPGGVLIVLRDIIELLLGDSDVGLGIFLRNLNFLIILEVLLGNISCFQYLG
jgi:hypothetical protein